MITLAIMKIFFLKTWVGILKNMGGNIAGGSFQAENCPGDKLSGRSLIGGYFPDWNLRVGVFLVPTKIYPENSQVYMHWNWSSSKKYSFSKPITSVFSPLPIITFSYGAEIFPHPSVRLTGHISPLIG